MLYSKYCAGAGNAPDSAVSDYSHNIATPLQHVSGWMIEFKIVI
jgi:hypothetical protein